VQRPRLTDGRVILRPWEPRDVHGHIAAIDDPEIARWIDYPIPLREEDALAFFGWDALHLGVFGPDDATVLGGVGLDPVDRDAGWAEILWWVARDARRTGVGRAAVQLLVDWAFGGGGLRVVEARIQRPNAASQAFARALGFALVEGVVRREHRGVEVELLRFERRRPE
jgi:RimJ/RimL family protein N-acetyltransferase